MIATTDFLRLKSSTVKERSNTKKVSAIAMYPFSAGLRPDPFVKSCFLVGNCLPKSSSTSFSLTSICFFNFIYDCFCLTMNYFLNSLEAYSSFAIAFFLFSSAVTFFRARTYFLNFSASSFFFLNFSTSFLFFSKTCFLSANCFSNFLSLSSYASLRLKCYS